MPHARFIAFHAIPETPPAGDLAPEFAVVLAHGPAGVVLVFNRHRQVWELPGGFIDPGETAREGARRELAEEAGCATGALEWLGVVEVDDGRRRRGAVFACRVADVPAQIRNDEMDGIAAWTPHATPQPLGASDRALLERLAHAGPPKSP
jgi:ADP-ribose pyrophosphatase YjhB (NUDIX family)